MRIVIDLQGAQSSGSRNRGIGRYSTALALGMCKFRGDHEILLALNGAFPESVDEIRLKFAELLPLDAIRVYHPLPDVHSLDDCREPQRRVSEMAWEAFLASLKPDVVHVSSVFEGLSDDAVTSIGAYGYGAHLTAVTLYDLIPLINNERYLTNPVINRWYRRKIEEIQRADLLLSISDSSRQEGLKYLNFSSKQIINISTAADPQFKREDLSDVQQMELRARHRINRPYIMYTGGIDYRKNIEGLIAAYALLPTELRAQYALAVVCSCHEADRTRLLQLAKSAGLGDHDVIMTGFVPEDELIALYSSCHVFVFPSLHEGFGLPALEAMWCGAPVIGSNRSSLPEVIGWNDAMFDPFDSQSIASKLEQALADQSFRSALIKHGSKQRLKFSWDKTAQVALRAIEQCYTEDAKRRVPSSSRSKPRLAFVSPIPPARSGIADYSAELIPELAHYYRLALVVPDGFDASQLQPEILKYADDILSASEFAVEHKRYNRILYHFGNSDHHTHMFGLLSDAPGTVVLHDFFLSGILSYWQNHLKADQVWARALYNSHGFQALSVLRSGGIEEALWTYPSNRQVIEDADGVIVHSDSSYRLARRWIGDRITDKFTVIPHLRAPEPNLDSKSARSRLGFNADDIVICSFGIMGPTKQNLAILDAWLRSDASEQANVHLVFVGQRDEGAYGANIDEVIAGSGKASRIRITGWTDTAEFRDYLRAADIAIQLRTLSRGETSGTILDCMNFGLPVIVNANGSMADLPDDCVIKLEDEFALDSLIAAIDRLILDPEFREALGRRGRNLIETAHAPAHCAALYREAIERFAREGQSRPERVASNMRRHLVDVSDLDRRLLAQRLDWNAAAPNIDGRVLLSITSPELTSGEKSWLQSPLMKTLKRLVDAPDMPRIEPIVWSEDAGAFRYARSLMLELLGLPADMLTDDFVDFRIGDTLLDLVEPERSKKQADELRNIRRRLTLTYQAFSGAPHSTKAQVTTTPREIERIATHLNAAGWHLA